MANIIFSNIFNKLFGLQETSKNTKKCEECVEYLSGYKDDDLETFLKTEKEINELYGRRLGLIKDALFACGDTNDGLIDVIFN